MKICSRCQRKRREEMFQKGRMICKICQLDKKLIKEIEKTNERYYCTLCGNYKEANEFYSDNRNRNGLRSWCKKCCIEEAISTHCLSYLHELSRVPKVDIIKLASILCT